MFEGPGENGALRRAVDPVHMFTLKARKTLRVEDVGVAGLTIVGAVRGVLLGVPREHDRRGSASRLDRAYGLTSKVGLEVPLDPLERPFRQAAGTRGADFLLVLDD